MVFLQTRRYEVLVDGVSKSIKSENLQPGFLKVMVERFSEYFSEGCDLPVLRLAYVCLTAQPRQTG